MATRKIIDIEQNGEKVWPKGHAKATFMSNGTTVEDAINSIQTGTGGGVVSETDPIFSASPAASITEVKKAEWDNKVDKVSGKQLSTEDFTSALKSKLEGLSNYDDTTLANAISGLETRLNTLVSGDATTAIESFNEITAFLEGIKDTQDLASIIASIEQQIASKMDKVTLAKVATSGDYNDLSNKPTIPTKVSQLQNDRNYVDEQTISDYIVKEKVGDLALAFADGLSTNSAAYALPDTANGDEDDIIVTQKNLKTINGESVVGNGDITIESGATVFNLDIITDENGDPLPSGTLPDGTYESILNADIVVMSGYPFLRHVFEEQVQLDLVIGTSILIINVFPTNEFSTFEHTTEIPTKTSQLENDSNFVSYPRITTDLTEVVLQPNSVAEWNAPISAELALSFAEQPDQGYAAEYIARFTVGADGVQLIVPDGVVWADGVLPAMTNGKTYELSFVDNLATFLEF